LPPLHTTFRRLGRFRHPALLKPPTWRTILLIIILC
jgi:hypothetical protein